MIKQSDDTQTLIRYLLGSLPAAETERLDELSVADDETAEALRAVENDLVDAYVQNELDEATRAQFKTHYLASPKRRERVSFAQTFQALVGKSLTSQATTATLAETATEAQAEVAPWRKGRAMFSAWRGFSISRPAWAWGAALAVLALLVVGGSLIFDSARRQQQPAPAEARRDATQQQAPGAQRESANRRASDAQPADTRATDARAAQEQTQSDEQRLTEQQRVAEQQRMAEQQRAAAQRSSSSRSSVVASFILAPQMRGAGRMQAVSIPTNADRVVMRLRLEPNVFQTYRAVLLDETGSQTLWRSSLLNARGAADSKILNLNLRARLLKPQATYVLRVTNDAGEIVDDYPFRVVK